MFIYLIMLIVGNLIFSLNRKHLLRVLLRLEFLVLTLFFILINYLNLINNEYFFLIIFLVFAVCEGVLGLSLIVRIIRIYGNDYFFNFNLLC